MNIEESVSKLIQGDIRTLTRCITKIESQKEDDKIFSEKLLNSVMSHTGKSLRIGISGVPGVGKSTFINAFGEYLISKGKKVAVLAVDPSSPVHGGSIMGDKTRMLDLIQQEDCFIRPSPSGTHLGGVAHKTKEGVLLCEAAGFDIILVETVGVGQSEVEVSNMVDFFLVLLLPNAGDEIQGIKKGIIELADGLIINKADGDNSKAAEISKNQYFQAVHLAKRGPLLPAVSISTVSSLEKTGMDEVYDIINTYHASVVKSNIFETRREKQNLFWFENLAVELFNQKISNDKKLNKLKDKLKTEVVSGKSTTLGAAKKFIDSVFSK
jgi:LAO/AO transport system kinase